MSKLHEDQDHACHLAHTASVLLSNDENGRSPKARELAELIMRKATEILTTSITVDAKGLNLEEVNMLRASAGLGLIPPVREARTRERGEHYQKDDGPLPAEMVDAIRTTSMVGDLPDKQFTKSLDGAERIHAVKWLHLNAGLIADIIRGCEDNEDLKLTHHNEFELKAEIERRNATLADYLIQIIQKI